MQPKMYCPKCKNQVRTLNNKNNTISGDYYAECLKCDEDFYLFELIVKW